MQARLQEVTTSLEKANATVWARSADGRVTILVDRMDEANRPR
jgi:hypothetical protein